MKIEFVDVPPGEEKARAAQLEREWIRRTLIKQSVPELKLDQAEYDSTVSASVWRNYLFETFGLEVVLDRATRRVKISRIDHASGKKFTIGEWYAPEIARRKKLESPSRLILQYTE